MHNSYGFVSYFVFLGCNPTSCIYTLVYSTFALAMQIKCVSSHANKAPLNCIELRENERESERSAEIIRVNQ